MRKWLGRKIGNIARYAEKREMEFLQNAQGSMKGSTGWAVVSGKWVNRAAKADRLARALRSLEKRLKKS